MAIEALSGWTKEQRNVVIAAYLGWMLDAFDFFLMVFVFRDIAMEFNTEESNGRRRCGADTGAAPIGAFIFGRAADRYGAAPDAGRSHSLLFGFGLHLRILDQPRRCCWCLRALFGIAMGGEWGVGASLAMETIPPKARGLVSGILQSGYPSGYLVASVVYGLLYQYIGWRGMFMIGIAPAFLAFFILRNVKESPAWTPKPALGADSIATLTAYGRLIIYAVLLWLGASLYGRSAAAGRQSASPCRSCEPLSCQPRSRRVDRIFRRRRHAPGRLFLAGGACDTDHHGGDLQCRRGSGRRLPQDSIGGWASMPCC